MNAPSATGNDPAAPAITVVMRSRNDIGVIGHTLDGLLSQSRQDFEVIALDNDSTDGTREAYLKRGIEPARVPAGSYNPGRVLNAGVVQARGRLVVFLNSDCTPANPSMLAELVAPLESGCAEAVYGRQLARADANAMVRRDHAQAFGESAPRWGPFFSLAVSAFERSVLLERPLPENVQYSEDLAWAVAASRVGLRIVYAPTAAVFHSHNYTPRELAKRFFEEGRADAHIFADGGRPLRPLRSAAGYLRDVALDTTECVRSGEWGTLPVVPFARAIQRASYLAGRLAGPRKLLNS